MVVHVVSYVFSVFMLHMALLGTAISPLDLAHLVLWLHVLSCTSTWPEADLCSSHFSPHASLLPAQATLTFLTNGFL